MRQITEIQQQRLTMKLENINQEIEVKNEALKVAKGFQDISENAEFDDAKQALTILENQKADILDVLQNSEVVKLTDSNRIVIGSLISVTPVINGQEGEERLFLFDSSGDTVISGILNTESELGKKINGNPSGDYNIQSESGEILTYRVQRESIDRLAEYDKEFPDEKEFFKREFTFK